MLSINPTVQQINAEFTTISFDEISAQMSAVLKGLTKLSFKYFSE